MAKSNPYQAVRREAVKKAKAMPAQQGWPKSNRAQYPSPPPTAKGGKRGPHC